MGFDLVVLAVIALLTGLGAWRGAAESGLRLLGWVGGYVFATYAGFLFGDALAAALGISAFFGVPLAGTLAFVALQLVLAVTISWVRRRRRESEPGGLDRLLGATLGAARGAILALLLGWLALWWDGLEASGVALPLSLPRVSDSVAARVSSAVVGEAGQALVGNEDPGARAAVAIAARPRASLDALHDVLEDPTFVALQRDTEFWSAMEAGESARAFAQPSYRALVGDPALRGRFAELGLVDDAAAANPRAFASEIEATLEQAGAVVARMRRDPEMRALLEDPEVRQLVERRDAVGLLMHPRFRSVLQRATSS